MKNSEAMLYAQIVPPSANDWLAVKTLATVARLAKKHHRLAEMACNGEGYIRGQAYTCGNVDEGSVYSVKSAYASDDVTVFDQESDRVETKIKALVSQLGHGWGVDFQRDPRGWTVKVYKGDRLIDLN